MFAGLGSDKLLMFILAVSSPGEDRVPSGSHTDPVIESVDEPEEDLVLWPAIGSIR